MEGGGSEEERLGVADEGRWVGAEEGALLWEGCFFGWTCSGGLKMGGILLESVELWGLGRGGGEKDGCQLLWLAACKAW